MQTYLKLADGCEAILLSYFCRSDISIIKKLTTTAKKTNSGDLMAAGQTPVPQECLVFTHPLQQKFSRPFFPPEDLSAGNLVSTFVNQTSKRRFSKVQGMWIAGHTQKTFLYRGTTAWSCRVILALLRA